jgi:aryl-alcohol dehydrogenase-like predicted oxidoreductase
MSNQDNKKKVLSRRDFLKTIGAAGVATTGLSACVGGGKDGTSTAAAGEIPTDRMTYRTNPTSGDKVSLLGFGMMRLPSVGGRSAREGNEEIDQEMVNELVDYAIAHGVNYFDTSPAYCRGKSEHATGIALSRHPRDKYFIATKLSNFSPATWSREASIAMYRNSLKELQVDYIDYLLLHGVGMGGGMEEFENRYMNNGILDFLLEERKAGRIRNLGFSYHGDVRVFDYLLSRHDEYKWDFVQIQLNYMDWKYAKQINPRNTDAEYLYGELEKRGIPAVIMEPLLGGRLSNVPSTIVPAQAARAGDERGFVGVPFCRQPAGRAYRVERHDPYGAFAGQPAHLRSIEAADGGGFQVPARDGYTDDAVRHDSLQRLQILYALPVWSGHSGHSAPLQQMSE